MKACPYCAEEIQDAAVVCKHCGRDLASGASPKAAKGTLTKPAGVLMQILAIPFLFGGFGILIMGIANGSSGIVWGAIVLVLGVWLLRTGRKPSVR